MLSYEASEEKLKAQGDTLDPEAVLVMEEVSLEEADVLLQGTVMQMIQNRFQCFFSCLTIALFPLTL